MVAGDFKMCQAVWRSPLLPESSSNLSTQVSNLPPIGCGARFGFDLLTYLRAYGSKLKALIIQLEKFDFSSIRAALVASTPGRQNLQRLDDDKETSWGWPGLKTVLQRVPVQLSKQSHVVVQVSSVANLGAGDKWLRETFLRALGAGIGTFNEHPHYPKFSLIFPTADEIRRSLEGYDSGGSVHMKTQSPAQARQLEYVRPMLCHWAGDNVEEGSRSASASNNVLRDAGRKRTTPHMKTYIRFTDSNMDQIDWAMVTSANLSTQAWGAAASPSGEVRICSYEIGVVVWPALWKTNEDDKVEMVPVFKKDLPGQIGGSTMTTEGGDRVVELGFRMPYDLPLVPYAAHEMPWCAAAPDEEPDWMGRVWPGF